MRVLTSYFWQRHGVNANSPTKDNLSTARHV